MKCSDCKLAEICKHNNVVSEVFVKLTKDISANMKEKSVKFSLPDSISKAKEALREVMPKVCQHFQG